MFSVEPAARQAHTQQSGLCPHIIRHVGLWVYTVRLPMLEVQAWRDTILCTRNASHDTLAHTIVHSAEGAQG
jgi:hypothetical protein